MLGYVAAQTNTAEYQEDMWRLIAMAARYGHQPLPEIMDMTFERLDKFTDALSYLIDKENSSRKGGPNPTGG